jgi:hypothetical protein
MERVDNRVFTVTPRLRSSEELCLWVVSVPKALRRIQRIDIAVATM